MKRSPSRARTALVVATPLAFAVVLGCGQPDSSGRTPTRSGGTTTVAADRPEPPAVAAAPAQPAVPVPATTGAVTGIPDIFFGKFTPSLAACDRVYGPVTVTADQLDFGWGRADVKTIAMAGSSYRIVADLFQEGQVEPKPERITYTLSKLPRGPGIMFGQNSDVEAHQSCSEAEPGSTMPTSNKPVR